MVTLATDTALRGIVLGLVATLALGGCGGAGSAASSRSTTITATTSATTITPTVSRAKPVRRPAPPASPRVLAVAGRSSPTGFVPAAVWRGQTAVWVARRGGVALLALNQRLVGLRLHSGTADAGSAGWLYGPRIAGQERRRLVGAFNGGFKLDTGSGGFTLGGRTAVALAPGLGSIVTYASGQTDIGAWHSGVPAPGRPVVSVRQNLHLLVAGGRTVGTVGCLACWGAALGGTPSPARSALGITGDGHLVWAGGEQLTPSALATALIGAHVQRAVELDINPEWVAGYLYSHHRALAAVPIVPGQTGVPGQFLTPYSRDFFTVVGR